MIASQFIAQQKTKDRFGRKAKHDLFFSPQKYSRSVDNLVNNRLSNEFLEIPAAAWVLQHQYAN